MDIDRAGRTRTTHCLPSRTLKERCPGVQPEGRQCQRARTEKETSAVGNFGSLHLYMHVYLFPFPCMGAIFFSKQTQKRTAQTYAKSYIYEYKHIILHYEHLGKIDAVADLEIDEFYWRYLVVDEHVTYY